MAAYQAALGYVVVRWCRSRARAGWLLLVPAAWVLLEWWRGWFLSGFPWLSLGYSQTDTWLAGLAPDRRRAPAQRGAAGRCRRTGHAAAGERGSGSRARVALVALVLPWTLGLSLRNVRVDATPRARPRSVAILQGAVPQDMKWLESEPAEDPRRLRGACNSEALGAELIVWPESALPDLANALRRVHRRRSGPRPMRAGSGVLMGVMRLDDDRHRLLQLGAGAGRSRTRSSTTRRTWCHSANTSRCRPRCANGCA